MKKYIRITTIFILILALCLSLAACGGLYKEYSVGGGKMKLEEITQDGTKITLRFDVLDNNISPGELTDFSEKIKVDDCTYDTAHGTIEGFSGFDISSGYIAESDDVEVYFIAPDDSYQVDDSKVHMP